MWIISGILIVWNIAFEWAYQFYQVRSFPTFDLLQAVSVESGWAMNEWVLAVALVIVMIHSVKNIVLLISAGTGRAEAIDLSPSPLVSVLIPCYNEERVLEATVAAIFESRGVRFHSVICIDDGSTDGTLSLARKLKTRYGEKFKVFSQGNAGKAMALNRGLREVRTASFVCIDADTLVFPDTLRILVNSVSVRNVAAVSGNMIAGGGGFRDSLICRGQRIEYQIANEIERRAFSRFYSVPVVPGAISAFSSDVVRAVGGFSKQTLAEDTELTMCLLSEAYGTLYQPAALAVTEVPTAWSQLYAQRLRWSTGKLQVIALLSRNFWRKGGRAFKIWLYVLICHCLAPLLVMPAFGAILGCLFIEVCTAGVFSWLVLLSLFVLGLCWSVWRVCRSYAARVLDSQIAESGRERASGVVVHTLVLILGCVATWNGLFRFLFGKTTGWGKLNRRGDVRLSNVRRQ
ncbi:glycosyltransferase family 2 protein [Pseudomonas fulva]|uniref:glycosyltransferase n=1 Tax=Pseudomonas fulva TaxID=47880 RepID=UPI0018A8F58E|nr:glycosyltransferase family 2 protein [Pseudomonas fulva]MBF8675047.1 glycosyltransferase family 2 protein [Pseudomonas fulva]MBF8696393.1 glycosyltransferase family 2 protein [Pseudomonas fulva]